MADSREPKEETVRIVVSPPGPSPSAGSGETVRIHLPSRPPANRPEKGDGAHHCLAQSTSQTGHGDEKNAAVDRFARGGRSDDYSHGRVKDRAAADLENR